jgi:ankyrin repeat protein
LPIALAPSGRWTALHFAAWNGCTKSAVALLVGGADQTVTNNQG